MSNKRPVVLVHGMFGFGPKELGSLSYWGTAFTVPSLIERFEASVGPISSPHDRACELAAQIKGTLVDYGDVHSQNSGHTRYGKDYTGFGFIPDWSIEHPVHLVGHSLGGPTIRCLQYLLDLDYWGWGSNRQWVCSITAISGSNNGSTATYYYGADEQTGLLQRSSGIAPLLHLLELYTAVTGQGLDNLFDFDLDHWGYKRLGRETLVDYLRRVAVSPFFWGSDNAFYAATLQGSYRDNGQWPTYPETYYFSTITEQTYRLYPGSRYYPSPFMNPYLFATATYIGKKQFDVPPIPVESFTSEEWWENDGLLSTYSQTFPHTNGSHPFGGEFTEDTDTSNFKPGKWYYEWARGIDHSAICISPRWWQKKWQRDYYERLFSRLAGLEIM